MPTEPAPVGQTPSAKWRANGEPDPHGNRYDRERATLAMGSLTDDQLANAVFLHGDTSMAYLMAAKDRIRWLSRQLDNALAHTSAGSVRVTELVEQLQEMPEDLLAIVRLSPEAKELVRLLDAALSALPPVDGEGGK